MIVHTPKGTFEVDPDALSDEQLEELGIGKESLTMLKGRRNLVEEVDELRARIILLEGNAEPI